MKKTIMLDIDDCMNDFTSAMKCVGTAYCLSHGLPAAFNASGFSFEEKFGVTREVANEIWKENLEKMYREMPPRSQVAIITKILKAEGYQLVVTTARTDNYRGVQFSESIFDITKDWLDKSGITYDRLIVGVKDKFKLVEELDALTAVDDSSIELGGYATVLPYVIKFKTGANRMFNADNLFEVSSWLQIYKAIKTIDKKVNGGEEIAI